MPGKDLDVAGLGRVDATGADVDAGRGQVRQGWGYPHPPAYPEQVGVLVYPRAILSDDFSDVIVCFVKLMRTG